MVFKPREKQVFEDRKCDTCGELYTPTNGRQKYCPAHSRNVQHNERKKKKLSNDGYTMAIHGKVKTDIATRIEHLGKLNDEHRRLVEAKDRDGLLRLEREYLALHRPCTILAKAIRMQAESIHYDRTAETLQHNPEG